MPAPLRVLILEDRLADVELLLHELGRAGFEPDWRPAETEADFLAHLDPALDLILADYTLPQFDATRALHRLQERGLDIPFIVVTGSISEEVAVECMKRGAADYLLKDRLARLGPAVAQALQARKLRDEKRRAEAKYRTLVEQLPAATYIATLEEPSTTVYVSSQIEPMLGFSPAEWLTSADDLWIKQLHPEDRGGVLAGIAHSRATGEPFRFEYRLLARDGRVVWVRDEGVVIRDETGQAPFLQGIMLDITERKQAEAALRESEARKSAILQAALDAIITIDERGAIAEFNPAAEQVFGYSAAEAVGQPLADLLIPDDLRAQHRAGLRRYLQTGEAHLLGRRIELPGLRADGAQVPLELAITRINVSGPPVFTAFVRDISDRKRAEEALREADRRAIQAYELLLGRLTNLAQAVGTARDLTTVYRALLKFAVTSAPCNGIFVSLYDRERQERICVYSAGDGEEDDVSTLPPMPMNDSPQSRAIATGQVIVTDDLQAALVGKPVVNLGLDRDPRLPQSSLAVPMTVLGRVIGALEIQSVEPAAYTQEHVTAMQMAANLAAIATENVKLYDAVRVKAARAEALAGTAARLNTQLDLEAVLNAVCEDAARALNAPAASLSLYDERRGLLYHGSDFGLPREYRQRVRPAPLARFTSGGSGRIDPLIIIPNVQKVADDPNAELYAAMNIQAIASAPLLRETQLIGTLNIHLSGASHTFSDDELALLKGLADQAAQAIVNARLFEETQRRLQHLQALRSVDMAITSSLDLRLTLNLLLEQVTAQLKADAADILLLNPHTQTLEYAAGRGFLTRNVERSRLRLGEGHAGRAALERRSALIADLNQADDVVRAPLLEGEGFVSCYVTPLVAKGLIKGVLELFQRTPLAPGEEWIDFLEALAGQAAIAVDNAELFDSLQRSNLELALAYDTTLEGWSKALDLRDRETEGHTRRVAQVTERLARAMGIGEAELVHIRRGALLHDIGKMGIPDSVLLKPGALTEEEWVIMRQHPTFAFELLSSIPYLRPALDIPYCHHEKWDGTGYPRGLKGEQIPLAARIFAVVDVWDALRSDRPYREGWPEEKVRAHLREQSGKHFDPVVVEAFMTLSLG